ncbi:MAG: hypothetical protein DRI57_16775 [Deltaproteobacteria bacterium]|nr:MAG: hypothetical protein DRI57_16775 [Deltaproteobacteria bacterium]
MKKETQIWLKYADENLCSASRGELLPYRTDSTGETCEGFGELSRVVSKTSQVFSSPACHARTDGLRISALLLDFSFQCL